MNLAAIDLNLLNVLATVLEKRSATRAAAELHVTQSAVSNALKRARELFGDPLVVRRPYGLEPTARASALLPSLRAWLEEARRLVAGAEPFDPACSTRTFCIACSDAVAVTLLQPMLRLLDARAPGTSLRMQTLDRLISESGLERGETDLLIGIPPVLPPRHEAELVYRDELECIVRRDHPTLRSRLTLAAFASLPHVDLALFDVVDDTIDRALSRHGRSRTVRVALPHFSSVPLAVLATDCIATLSSRLARTFAARLPLRVFPPPVALDAIEVRQVWHRRSEADGAVEFLRTLVRDAAQLSSPKARGRRRS
ncbi:MAG: LysR family transcriptional regulator [Deltaproteobacteria bacterium]